MTAAIGVLAGKWEARAVGFGGLAIKRSRARSRLLIAIFAIMAIITFALTTMVGYVDSAQTSAVRQELLAPPEASTAIQLMTEAGGENEAKATGLIVKSFAPGSVDIQRTVHTTDFEIEFGGDTSRVSAGSNPALVRNTTLVEGTWPTFTATPPGNPVPVAIQAKAADALGLSPGDTFRVGKLELIVSATWLPDDVIDRSWFGDPSVATGFNGRTIGPLMMAEENLAKLPARSDVRLTVVPTVDRITTEELHGLSRALKAVTEGVDDDLTQTEISGDLGTRVTTLEKALGASRGLLAVPFALIAIIGFITITQVERLLASVREIEMRLLRARGASARQLTAAAAWEAAATAVPGIVVGGLLAAGILASTGRSVGIRAAILIAGFAAIAAIAVSAYLTWRAAISTLTARGRETENRGATLGAAVIASAAAALSLWQFRRYGSTVDLNADGAAPVDPLTAFAPVLVVLALALLATFVFAALASFAETLLSRPTGILPSLPGRQVARQASIFGIAVILIVLAVGGATLAALFTDTWSGADDTASRLRNGTDVRIALDVDSHADTAPEPVTTGPFVPLAAVTSATPVVLRAGSVDRDSISFLAMAAGSIDAAMTHLDGVVDTGRLTKALAADAPGTEIDGNEVTLSLEAVNPDQHDAGRLEVAVWIADAKGAVARLVLGDPRLDKVIAAGAKVSAPAPSGVAPWRVLAIEPTLVAGELEPNEQVTVEVRGLSDEPIQIVLSGSKGSATSLIGTPPTELPVVITRDLATLFGLDRGDTFDFLVPDPGSGGTAKVADIVPRLPGSTNPRGVMADLPALNYFLLGQDASVPQANEVWLGSDAPAQTATAAAAAGSYAARVTTVESESGAGLIRPVVTTLRWGAAAAIGLSVLAVLAITSALATGRTGELRVLRALGLSRRSQVRNRLIELGAVVALATIFGVTAGAIGSALTLTGLVRGAIPNAVSSVPIPIQLELWSALLLLAILVTGLAIVARLYAGRVRADLASDRRELS